MLMDKSDTLRRCGSLSLLAILLFVVVGGAAARLGFCPGIKVVCDELREMAGRRGLEDVLAVGIPGVLTSSLGARASLRMDRAEVRPPTEPALLRPSAYPTGSPPGIGDGAAEPRPLAAFLICARSWAVCRSVR